MREISFIKIIWIKSLQFYFLFFFNISLYNSNPNNSHLPLTRTISSVPRATHQAFDSLLLETLYNSNGFSFPVDIQAIESSLYFFLGHCDPALDVQNPYLLVYESEIFWFLDRLWSPSSSLLYCALLYDVRTEKILSRKSEFYEQFVFKVISLKIDLVTIGTGHFDRFIVMVGRFNFNVNIEIKIK